MIEDVYHEFLKLTGEPIAASMLTLAKVIENKPESVALTVKQAARAMNVSERLIYQLCEDGRLRHQKIGRAIRIQPEDLQAIKVEHTQGGKHRFRHINF